LLQYAGLLKEKGKRKKCVMADLPSPRSPDDPAGQSTRQLLEELDDLMQRMLALPVQQGDEESAPEQPAALKTIAPTSADVQSKKPFKGTDTGHRSPDSGHKSVHLLHVPAMRVTVQAPVTGQPAQDVAATAGQATRPKPAERTPPSYRDKVLDEDPAPTYLPVGAEPLLPILLQHPSKAPTKAPATPPASPPRPQPVAPRPSWMPTPSASPPVAQGSFGWLLTINENFDTCTRLLGPAGHWLRGEQGRSIVGWSGLAMIAAALIWAAILFLG
jgi:hypothetical protein